MGQVPVPYVHGRPAGEIALRAFSRGWVSRVPRMTTVKMQSWNRAMTWQDTGLRWHPTSPNIPYATSPFYYVATGICGGAAAVDVGIGSANQFGYAGGSGVTSQAMRATSRASTPPGAASPPSHTTGYAAL